MTVSVVCGWCWVRFVLEMGVVVAKFVINKTFSNSATVEAADYGQEGDYFVFYDDKRAKILTRAASTVQTIVTETDSE